MKILRKLGIPAAIVAGALTLFSPSPANARVHFRVVAGGPYPAYGYVYAGSHHHHRRWHHYHHDRDRRYR